MFGGDTVVHHQPAFPDSTEQFLAIQRQVGMPDMLEHAHADHFVEATILGQIAIIENLQLHFVGQALGFDTLPAELELLLAQGNTEHLGVIFACCKTRKPTPTTPNV